MGKRKLPHVSEGMSPEKLRFRTLRNDSLWKDTVSEAFGRLENRKNRASEHFGRSVGEKIVLPNTSGGVILEKLSFRSVRKAKKWQKQSFRSVRNDGFLKMTRSEGFGKGCFWKMRGSEVGKGCFWKMRGSEVFGRQKIGKNRASEVFGTTVFENDSFRSVRKIGRTEDRASEASGKSVNRI